MSRRRRRKRHTGLKIFLVLVLVLAAGGLIFRNQIKDTVKQKAAGVVMEQVVQQAGDLNLPGDIPVAEIYEKLDEEDKETLNEIIADHVTEETIQDVKEYVEDGDMQGLEQYVEENLTGEDNAKLQELYEKYKDQLPQ